jgi:tyrosyl-tRNA synthetase
MKNVIDVLRERGFIDAITSEELRTLADKPLKVYAGFDPTSDSLHLGNLVAIMGLAWFQKFGHTPVAIVGGATGMVGDPSGKSVERQLLDEATIQKNLVGIRKNLEVVLNKGPLVLLNNYDWFKDFSFISFLRDVGKYFRVGVMLAKDSVKSRMSSEEGMSFTEFSYQLLQGYDFLHLYDHHNVILQIGGSDQWGNIIAGTELIRKVRGAQTFGLTFPLLVRSDGQKFGKSEKGAVWLSPEKLSVYEFYQYLVRVPDADVIMLMRMLTFMDMEEIREYKKQMESPGYVPNTAQKRLAEEVTRLIHGDEGLEKALQVTKAASPGTDAVLNVQALEAIAQHMPNYTVSLSEFHNVKLVDFLVKLNLQPSKSEARRLIKNGGVYLNNQQTLDDQYSLTKENLVEGALLLLALGKKNKVLVRVGN